MIVDSFINLIDKFSNKASWIKDYFGKYPYNGLKRYGDNSTTDYMDLTYDEIKVNDCFYIKQNNKVHKIIITAKLKYILFYTILNTKICGYIDCGASSNNHNYFYKAVPKKYYLSYKGNSALLDRYIYLESTLRDRDSSYINKNIMKLVNQSVKVLEQKDFSFEGIKNFIKEYCYYHLEFAPVYLKLTGDEKLSRKYRENPYSKVVLKYPEGDISNIYCVPTHYITTNYKVIVKNCWEEDLKYLCEPTEYHAKLYTVHFISNKLVISKLKNIINSFIEYDIDDSLAFVIPDWCKTLHEGTEQEYSILEITPDEAVFMDYIQKAQNLYISLIDDGWTSQQASAILPLSVKTELIACGFKEDWQHLFDIYRNTKPSMTKELVDSLQEKIKEIK